MPDAVAEQESVLSVDPTKINLWYPNGSPDELKGLAGRVSDSGEGRWTVKAAVDVGVPVPVLAASLFERFASRLSYVSGDFGESSTYDAVAEAIGHAETPVFYLEIPPFLFGRTVKGLAEAWRGRGR